MARRWLFDDDVQALIRDQLVPLFAATGSVNAMAHRLNSARSREKPRIYPNRLHTLLSEDRAQFVNEATLEATQEAVDALPALEPTIDVTNLRRQAYNAWARRPESADRLSDVATELQLPRAVVTWLLREEGVDPRSELGRSHSRPGTAVSARVSGGRGGSFSSPDWGFQDDAHRRCLLALRKDPSRKVGLVIPTGGGKTRVALRVALSWLSGRGEGTEVLWVSHRKNLKAQAHRELQEMLNTGVEDLPEHSAHLLAKRIHFGMLSQVDAWLNEKPHSVGLVVVDEAHHAAALSYQPIFETSYPLNGLFLTATPNRTDALPIGVDEIAYSIAFSDLEKRGVIIRPDFEDFLVDDFDWSPEAIKNLADEVIDRASDDFVKTLVLAPRIAKVEAFYEALLEALAEQAEHPLSPDDIGYVHGQRNSAGHDNEAFLAAFAEKPRAIIVSAQMLLEGFDDRSINAVVVTYPSNSLIQVIQAAGRCVRYAPNKRKAIFVQARQDALAYHFEQRWLYQEISDQLRPELEDVVYRSKGELREKVTAVLERHNVGSEVYSHVLSRVEKLASGTTCRMLLTGLPYFGDPADFGTLSEWQAILETEENSSEFRYIFNDFCSRGPDNSDPTDLLQRYAKIFGFKQAYRPADKWRIYSDMLLSMYRAYSELYADGARSFDGAKRPFMRQGHTTWLRYFTFNYMPAVVPELQEFVQDAHNASQVIGDFERTPEAYAAAVKFPLPLGGTEAYLLTEEHKREFLAALSKLRKQLSAVQPGEQYYVMAAELTRLSNIAQLPGAALQRLEYLLRDTDFETYFLTLPKETALAA